MPTLASSSFFNPRDVEVLAAALPPQSADPIGRLARDVLVLHVKRLTPGTDPDGRSFREVFFPHAGHNPHEDSITPLTGLGDAFFADVAVAMACRLMADVTSDLRNEMNASKADSALHASSDQLRATSYRYYAEMAKHADSPIRAALAVFPDEAARAEARRHYLAGLTSRAWVNAKLVQYSQGTWTDRDWELFHHWIKLTALGCPPAEIDAAITAVAGMGLPVPPSLLAGHWQRQAPWFARDFAGTDAQEATQAMIATKCHYMRKMPYKVCLPDDMAHAFTAQSQPGWFYRDAKRGSCFAPGTRVVMADGTLRGIEAVRAGDAVATPSGARKVLVIAAVRRGARELMRFEGTSFDFTRTHPFLVDPESAPDAPVYAAVDPAALARSVPMLGQFGIRTLSGVPEAVLLRHRAEGGDVPFPAPAVRAVPEVRPEYVYDLFLEVGPDGRSEYYVGDESVQVLVSSEVPRFAVAPETTEVVLHVLQAAGPTVLRALHALPDEEFEPVLAVGLDALARTLMVEIGPELRAEAGAESRPEPGPGPRAEPESGAGGGADAASALAAAVRAHAGSLTSAGGDYDRRAGVLVEAFASHFATQFQTALALPWRTFRPADAGVATILAVTVSGIQAFRPGPPVADAEIEVALVRQGARVPRILSVQRGAPSDRWYYGVDGVAYFPEWSAPEAAEPLWQVEVRVRPGDGGWFTLTVPRGIAHGYQAFSVPTRDEAGVVIGEAALDVRLLTLEGYVDEVTARDGAVGADRAAGVGRAAGAPITERLARLAAEYVEESFAEAVKAFRPLAG